MIPNASYLVFRVQNFRIAVRTDVVSEVTRMIALEPFPGNDPCLRGLFSLRGTSVYTFDLQPILSVPDKTYGPESRIITTQTASSLLGIMAHSVDGISFFDGIPPGRRVDLPSLVDVSGLRDVFDTPDGFVLFFDPLLFFTRQSALYNHSISAQIPMFEETTGGRYTQ